MFELCVGKVMQISRSVPYQCGVPINGTSISSLVRSLYPTCNKFGTNVYFETLSLKLVSFSFSSVVFCSYSRSYEL